MAKNLLQHGWKAGGNCFPGLEYDHRNLDRRFLPGLLVEFVSADDLTYTTQGARLLQIDLRIRALCPPQPRRKKPQRCANYDKTSLTLRQRSAVENGSSVP